MEGKRLPLAASDTTQLAPFELQSRYQDLPLSTAITLPL
jgi:hypothetical protein